MWYVYFKNLLILSMIDEISRDTSALKKKKGITHSYMNRELTGNNMQ